MIWFLGDSAVRSAVLEFAGDQEVLDSAKPEATPEHIWTEQIHDGRRKWASTITVVVYLPQQEYDSEATVWWVLSKSPPGSIVIYLMPPESPMVKEGLDHFQDLPVYGVEIQSTAHEHVLEKLRAA